MTLAASSDSGSGGANGTEPSNQEAQHAQKTSLSLEITNPPSSSPFPSPSSSFLPPPMMQKNEFALPTKFATKAKKVGDLPSPSSQQPQNGIADAVNGSSSLEEPTKVNGVAANDTKSPVQASTSSSLEPSIPPPSTSTSNSLATSAVAPHGVTTIPSLTPTTPTPNSIFHKHKTSSTSSSPTTPLPTTPHRLSQPVVPIPSPPASPRFSGPLHPNSSAKKANRDSTASFTSTGSGSVGLTSSRPAPPSPAMSRRTSAALSRAGSTRRASGILGGGGDKRGSLLGFTSPSTTTAETGRASTPVPKDAAVTNSSSLEVTGDDMGMSYRTPIQIRDYGYSDSDLRQLGLGVDGRSLDVPKPNRIRLLNKRLLGEEGWRAWRKDEKVKRRGEKKRARDSVSSVASVGSSQFSEDDWEEGTVDPESEGEDDGNNGWGNFKFGLGRFSWGLSSGSGSKGVVQPEIAPTTSSSNFPTQTELDRNFNFPDSSESSDTDDTEGEDEERKYYSANASPMPEAEDGYAYAEEEDLYPGLYKALYSFEPEGTAEMALQEDQLVRVVGRGGGVGWAVVVVDGVDEKGNYVEFDDTEIDGEGKKKHALVPESYLEVVKLDLEEDG